MTTRKVAGRALGRLGVEGLVKRTLVGACRLPERVGFLLDGAPPASSAIVLAGSGRSGTTWLADAVCTRTRTQQVFEPLHPEEVPEVRALAGWGPDRGPHIRSHYLDPDRVHPAWRDFLERVSTGRVRNWWTDVVRTSWMPRRFLVKAIRANLMLGFWVRELSPHVVLVVRHPCAVVSSRLHVPWHADVADILCQEELVECHLRPWLAEIEREKDLLGAHAVWWAVENLVATRQLAQRRHFFAFYEDLALAPDRRLGELFSWLELGHAPPRSADLLRPSRMTHPGNEIASLGERLGAWRTRLSELECDRVLSWATRMGLDWYDREPLPRRQTARS